ncbi:glutathione peroxidase [Ureaplasma parvum]|uniref:glutathione peroxidase n=1 Tax=Ureaplasma parvum TaxID=134821 RepID=UPI00307D8435
MKLSDYPVLDIDKKLFNWSKVKNKLVLIVNVASKCGYAKQYEQLEYLYKKYKNKGFIIVAFPCRQFMFQEFDDNNKIKEFCSTKYNVTFPIMDLTNVVGSNISPLYKQLITEHPWSPKAKAVKWNFEKFFVKNDEIIGRFESKCEPNDLEEFIKNNL